MINSINSLEFLKSKLLTMDKYSSTTTATKILPPTSLTQTKTFATISDHQKLKTIDSLQEKFLFSNEIKNQDRVMVQHLQNHTNLQNNKCCNTFRTLYNNISASSNVKDGEIFQMYQTKDDSDIDVVNVEHLNSTTETTLSLENKSAFNVDFNRKYQKITVGNNNLIDDMNQDTSVVNETNRNLQFHCKQYNNCSLINIQSPKSQMILMPTEPQINAIESQRTEDQDQAYRHIESVHNYAKSKSLEGDDDKTSPNGSRHSSYLDDEDEDEDDEVNGDAEYDNDDNIDYEDGLPVNLEADYEDIFSNRRYQRTHKLPNPAVVAFPNKPDKLTSTELQKRTSFINILKDHKLQHIKLKNNKINNNYDDEEVHIDVDVETVDTQLSPNTCIMDTNPLLANNCIDDENAGSAKPDHHARRPMNAFLIFCKRHRAIVKDRYKNLENRAITKILGDWWASLDSTEKKCFTNLAQQNKDAFFSANPNFKWYKLPAPPLRTLTTRPANALSQEFQEDNNGANGLEMISNISCYNNNNSNYFKFADEAQMGDLSQLMEDKSKTLKQCAALQQALGETSQFISAHISSSSDVVEQNRLKRRLYNENSFSGNSSEEDIMEPKKKNARSCKGKRYQELINSGQIATALKKSKSLTRPISEDAVVNSEINIKQNCSNVHNFNNLNDCQKRSVSEAENIMSYDLNGFDLEEKIKELPGLNLDDYLQRKRSTKKKKKFSCNGKKRGQRSSNTNISRTDKDNQTVTNSSQSNERLEQHLRMAKYHQQQAVGSQKRKARKESITRRDVSVIEQEVASLLPLTINGCCYFQETPLIIKNEEITDETNSEANWATSQSLSFTSTSPIIPIKRESSSPVSIDVLNSSNVCSNNILNDNISSSTSDLLILAEVAANRTELKH